MVEKEHKVRTITRIYYSNPKVQEVLANFSKDREVVPRYMEAFGKRPDTIQYPSEVMSSVMKGATSFHVSEELWKDPLQLNPELSQSELSSLRKSWDLLIDIDSPYLDYSKIAARLILDELERHGVKNYGLKFSGSKGFHIIIPADAFPKNFNSEETRKMFPEWPRAICNYLMYRIKLKYNKEVTKLEINFSALKERTNLSKEDVTLISCPNCRKPAKKTNKITLKCERCGNLQIKPNYKKTSRKLKCIENTCPGFYEIIEEKDLYFCEHCKHSDFNKADIKTRNILKNTLEARKSGFSEAFREEISGEKMASLDLVLVAPRHLFRAPYSLHEKTALSSVVIDSKHDISKFTPRDADPMKIKIKEFYPKAEKNEAKKLLESALEWSRINEDRNEEEIRKKYASYEKIDITQDSIPEEAFPKAIRKLLKGLKDGRKRGLFILLTFLRSLNFSPAYINEKVRNWNKKNDPPLKEGYVKSQIDWHLRQKRTILPPNYKNQSFYKDLKLIDFNSMPKAKNPISEVLRKFKRQN